MAQKTLNAFVVLGGRVDNSFGQIGSELISLGSTVDEISGKLLNFGKESLNVYKDFNYNMTEMETVWGSNGTFQKDSRELTSAMTDMKDAVAKWAASSIFHTNDISNAMVEAAHAGWDYNEMLEGVPAAMAMAQAGGMDLSTAMNYVVKAQKSFGWGFDETLGKIDEWIYAANKSAGMTSEFGDTFLKLGSTVRLASNTEELLALTKVMHDMGTTGSAAGTLIRTSLMRLYAPSGKASKVLDALGYSLEDIKELGIMEDKGLVDALNTLEMFGFSAFDPITKEAKPVLQTYSELGKALVAISGYTQEAGESTQQFYERVLKHKTVMGIMSEVFGIRGIQGSMNILMSLDEAMEMYGDLTQNAAAGTTEYVREMMNDTLYGSTELFLSKVEELHRRTGEELAGDWQKIQGFVGSIVDELNTMDDEKFGIMVDGLKTIAMSGAAMIGAGSLFRLLGFMATVPGMVAMVTVGAGAAASALNSLREARLEGMFGDMPLDMGGLNEYVRTLGNDFNEAYKYVNNFAESLGKAVSNYEKASASFSSDLLSALLTKKDFTPEEQAALQQKGIDIYTEVLGAINASADMASEFWAALYGGRGEAEFDPKFQGIVDLLESERDGATKQAEAVGERIKNALLKGFEDGFTEDDYAIILSAMEEYNDLVARAANEAQSEEQFIAQKKMLHKAQTASLEDMKELARSASEQRDAQLAEFEDMFLTEQYRLEYRGADAATLAANQEKYDEWRARTEANYDEFLLTLWQSQLNQSGLADSYDMLQILANHYFSEGADEKAAEQGYRLVQSQLGNSRYAGDFLWPWEYGNTREQLGEIMGNMIMSLGGEQEVMNRIRYYRDAGEEAAANRLHQALVMEQLVNGFSNVTHVEAHPWDFLNWTGNFGTSAMNSGESWDTFASRKAAEDNRKALAELGPLEVEVTYPGAVDEAAKTHAEIAKKFPNITQTVTIETIYSDAGLDGMAEGGRADRPVIFGEAGPEWFIPEKHTPRTAGLILGAAYASGFDIFDLAERAGARLFADGGTTGTALSWPTLNDGADGAEGGGIQVQYSPVIHADNAAGVERALKEDKKRFEKWMEEWWAKRQLYESLVTYQ